MTRGRALSVTLLLIGGLAVPVGFGLIAAILSPLAGVGVAVATLGLLLILAALFLVPVGSRS